METPGPSMYLILLILLALSAFFSASETALSSANRVRLRNWAQEGDARAQLALDLIADYDRTLSTILVGNNVVNLTASSLSTLVATALLGSQYGPLAATIAVTVLVLIFGEILPKSIANDRAEDLSVQVARPLNFLRTLFYPVVMVFVWIRRVVSRPNPENDGTPSVTEAELKTIIDTVGEEGVLDSRETDMMQSVIQFDDTTVQRILVPRVDLVAVEADAPQQEILDTVLESGYTRIPVYEGDIDHIIGMLYAKDLLACLAKGEPVQLRKMCRDVTFVYRTKHTSDLLAELRRKKQHMAVVIDDYGGTLGIVTMEDLLEELVGEIFDETDEPEEGPIQLVGDGLYRVDGDTPVDDLFETVGSKAKDCEGDFSSAAGWALAQLEHIPQAGETFTFENLHVTVGQVKDKRILTLMVRVTPDPKHPAKSRKPEEPAEKKAE